MHVESILNHSKSYEIILHIHRSTKIIHASTFDIFKKSESKHRTNELIIVSTFSQPLVFDAHVLNKLNWRIIDHDNLLPLSLSLSLSLFISLGFAFSLSRL